MSTRIDLMGLPVDVLDPTATVEHVMTEVEAGRGGYLLTPNLDHLRHYVLEPGTRSIMNEAPLIVADGMPLVWASRLQGTALPRRVPGSDLIVQLAEAAASHGLRVFLLGAGPGVAARCAEELCRRFPALDIVGTHSPPMAFEESEEALAAIRSELVAARPDLVVMGLPFPKQEKLGAQLRDVLPRAWFAGLGASLDFIAGEVVRAPEWMHDSGLEWLHRLRCEPRRLFHRYVVDGLPFAGRLGLHALLRRGIKVLERA